MIDLSRSGYSHEHVLKLLHTPQWIKGMNYRIDITRNGVPLPSLKNGIDYTDATIEYNGKSEVKHSGSITMRANGDINWNTDRIKPVMWIEHQGTLFEFSFVPMIGVTPKPTITPGYEYIDVECYDETIKLQENSLDEVPFFRKGTVYTTEITKMLEADGFDYVYIEPSGLTMSSDREDWGEDTDKIVLYNDLLSEINYTGLTVDRNGRISARKYIQPDIANAKISYTENNKSVLLGQKKITYDSYKRPNSFKGIVFNSDMDEPLYYKHQNTDPSSPTSIPSVGYVRHKNLIYDNVPDLATLQELVHRDAFEYAKSYEYATITTTNMPYHEDMEVISVISDGVEGIYEESAWKMRFAKGGTMTHDLQKVVFE